MKLCCIFNMAPLYRKSIYHKIDNTFDTQFCFGHDVHEGQKSGIKSIDWNSFKKYPKTIKNRQILGRFQWRSNIQTLPFHDYDKFIITGDFPFSYIPFLLSCKLLGKPVYAWGHGSKTFSSGTGFIQKFIIHLLTGYLTYSEGGKKRLEDLGIPERKIHVIYNSLADGVDAQSQKYLKSDIYSNHFQNSYPVVIFIGRLTKVKQLDWILKAQALHQKEGIFYNTVFIGDGSCRADLEKEAISKSLNKYVWFYGECYKDELLSPLIYNADLCVSPGNVGLTALHAMSYGTPVISHNEFDKQGPEYESIQPNSTGLLYKYGLFDDFCDSIKKWLNSNTNRNIVRQSCYDMINGKWNSTHQINMLQHLLNTGNYTNENL